jgi:hypothetical protein
MSLRALDKLDCMEKRSELLRPDREEAIEAVVALLRGQVMP